MGWPTLSTEFSESGGCRRATRHLWATAVTATRSRRGRLRTSPHHLRFSPPLNSLSLSPYLSLSLSLQGDKKDDGQGLWAAYNAKLESDPIVTKAMTSLVGFTLGDILAQKFVEKKDVCI